MQPACREDAGCGFKGTSVMANPEHVAVVRQGVEAVLQWRFRNPKASLDLSGADLREASLQGALLDRAILTDALLEGVDLQQTSFVGADLRGARLNGANLQRANLKADLSGAYLNGANLHRASLQQANFERSVLADANLSEAKLIETRLCNANLGKANLYRAQLNKADLTDANLTGACLLETQLSGAILRGVRGLQSVCHLETVSMGSENALYTEQCKRRWTERYCDWERLRTIGRLPLFGASYTALILIPIVFYGFDLYNNSVDTLQVWAREVLASTEYPLHFAAEFVRDHIREQSIPALSFWLLVSTLLLAVASTLYTFRCPSIIKDFNQSQWCYELNRSLIHYWAYAWKERWARLVCGICFVLGGIGALVVIGAKVWNAGCFIVRNTDAPWSLW
jgi:uncharacterized protein YjbI with pentapeptide repeats